MASSADIFLRAFILDYLNKRGMTSAAQGMRFDQIRKGEQPPYELSPDSEDNFLSNWFTMYWEVFSASIKARIEKGRVHPNPQVAQIAHQVQSQQQPHPSQHLQHQQPPQNPSAQQNQHPTSSSDPNNPIQQSQVQNPAQMFSFVGVDAPVAHATAPSAQAQNRLMSANIAQNPQTMFAARASMNQGRGRAHQQQKQGQQPQQQQVAPNMFNYPPFRNVQGSMQQMQNQPRQNAIRQQQPQQAMLQSTQRTQQNTSGTPRLRNASAENRHALSQGQLHSIALDSTIHGQKGLISADQAAAAVAMSRDMLDGRGQLGFESLLPSVGTRTSPSRNNGAAAASVPGRSRMQQFPGGVQTPQAAMGSNGLPLRANGGKPRSFSGLQTTGSEAPSTASRRGSMDVSVDGRPYEDAAIVDESQPRVGGSGTSTSGKRRAASQSVSRKSSGAGQSDDNASRRGSLGPGSESAGPAKRQRSTGAYQRNAGASPAVQMQKQIEGVDLDSLTQTMPQNGMQGHAASANHVQQALALHQPTQQYRQNASRMNDPQFLSQFSAPKNAIARGGNRYSGRANASPNPQPYTQNEQSQSNRQREVIMHGQLPSGRRTPMSNANSSTTNAGKGTDARPQSRTSKGNDTNVPMPQGPQSGMQFPVSRLQGDSPLSHLEIPVMTSYISNDDLPVEYRGNPIFAGLGNSGQQPKKVVQGSQQDGSMGKNVTHDQQSGSGTDVQQADVQMSAQLGRKESTATLRSRQPFRKTSSGMQVGKQDMAAANEKKSKAETNLNGSDKQNGFRGELKRTGSSRAMKTIETTGVNRGGTHPDGTNRISGMGTSAGALPQTGMNASLASSVAKRDRIAADADLENRSTKSDRQASGTRGSGTQSQKSTASGGSGAAEGRQATSSGPKKSRGRSRTRGGSGGRRGRSERVPPRGGNASRVNGVGQGSRNNGQEQKSAAAANRQRNVEAPRAPQSEQDHISSILLPPHGNTTAQENRSQPQKVDRVGRVATKHGDDADLQRAPKLSFDLGENNATAESRGPDVASDQQYPLMEMYGSGRSSGDINQSANDKGFPVQPLNFMGVGDGKIGGQGNSNFAYDISPYMASGGVEDTGLGEMLPPMADNIELMASPDLEDESILGGVDPGDLTITGRGRS